MSMHRNSQCCISQFQLDSSLESVEVGASLVALVPLIYNFCTVLALEVEVAVVPLVACSASSEDFVFSTDNYCACIHYRKRNRKDPEVDICSCNHIYSELVHYNEAVGSSGDASRAVELSNNTCF